MILCKLSAAFYAKGHVKTNFIDIHPFVHIYTMCHPFSFLFYSICRLIRSMLYVWHVRSSPTRQQWRTTDDFNLFPCHQASDNCIVTRKGVALNKNCTAKVLLKLFLRTVLRAFTIESVLNSSACPGIVGWSCTGTQSVAAPCSFRLVLPWHYQWLSNVTFLIPPNRCLCVYEFSINPYTQFNANVCTCGTCNAC